MSCPIKSDNFGAGLERSLSTMSEDPFSDFSKGKVIRKYDLLEQVGDHQRRRWLGSFLLTVWIVLWFWLALKTDQHWLMVVIFTPLIIGRYLFRMTFPVKTIGLVTFQDVTMTVKRESDQSELVIDLRRLKSMGIHRSVQRNFGINSSFPIEAYGMTIRMDGSTVDLIVREEMHLTGEDQKQFMAPPPTMCSTLNMLKDRFRVKLFDRKGRLLDVVPH